MTTVFCHTAEDSSRKTKLYNHKTKIVIPLKTMRELKTLGKILATQLSNTRWEVRGKKREIIHNYRSTDPSFSPCYIFYCA